MASSTGGPSDNQAAEVVVRLSAIDPHPTFEVPERSVVLDKKNPTMSIGRASKNKSLDCDMANCWFDSPVMSRKHAQLEVDLESKAVFLVDTGSLHGTFLNDRRLGKDERVKLANDDEARLGVEIVQGNKTFPPCRLRIGVVWADGHLPAFPPPILTQITPSFRVPDGDSDLDSSDPYTSDSDVEEVLSVPRSSQQQQNSVIDLTQDTTKPDVVDLTSPVREPSADLDGPASPLPDSTLTTEPAPPLSQHSAVEMPMSDAPPSPMSPSYSPLSPDFRRDESVDSQELDLAGYSDSDLESLDDEPRSIEHSSPPHSPLDADDVEPVNAAVPLLPEFPARAVATEGLGVTDTAVWGEDDSGDSENDESTESDPEYDSESLSDSDGMNEDDEYESEDEPMLPPLESVTSLQTMAPAAQPEATSLILPPLMDSTFPLVRQPSPSDAAMPKTIRTRFPGLEATPSTADVLGLKTGKYDFFVAREANKKFAEAFEAPKPTEPSGDVDYGMPHNFAFPGCTMPCIQPSSGPSPFPTLEATASDFRIAHLTSQTQPNIHQLMGFANYQASPNMPGTSSFRKEGADEMSMHNHEAFVSRMQVNTMPSGSTDNVTQTPKRIEDTTSLSQQDDSRCTHVSIGELIETTQAMEPMKGPMAHFREDSPAPQQKAQGFPGDAVLLSFMDDHRRRLVSDLPLVKSREASPVSQDNSLSSESRQESPDSCDDPLASASVTDESRENSTEPHNLSPGFAPAAPEIMELPALVMSSPTSAPEEPATPPTPESLLRMANPGAKRKRTEEAEEVVMPATSATPVATTTSASSQMRPTEPKERVAKKRRTALKAFGYAAIGAIGASVTLFSALVATAPKFD